MKQWDCRVQALACPETKGHRVRRSQSVRPMQWMRLAALFLALGGVAGAPSAGWAQDAAVSDKTLELEFWRSVSSSTDPDMFDAYLQQYPNGTFAPLAKVKAAALRRAAANPAPASPPNPAPTGGLPAAVVPVVSAPASPAAFVPAVAVGATSTAATTPALATAPADETADAGALANLAASQETPQGVPTASAGGLPPITAQSLALGRPKLEAVPVVTLPARFCSAEERNAFHAQTYRPANEAAQANNEKAIAYLQSIQARYDAMAMGDADTRNLLAKEGLEYKQVADATFQAQQALVRQFDALMAVPITTCGVAR